MRQRTKPPKRQRRKPPKQKKVRAVVDFDEKTHVPKLVSKSCCLCKYGNVDLKDCTTKSNCYQCLALGKSKFKAKKKGA